MSKSEKKKALERQRNNARAQQIALVTAVTVGVLAGVLVALVVLTRQKKAIADRDESGEALFV